MNYRKISAKIILLLLLLLPFLAAFPANAATLKVTLKSDYVQINSGGTAVLNITVKDATVLQLPVVGATVTFTATPVTCTAPATATTIAGGIINPPVTFTGPVTPPTVVCVIKATATKGGDTGSATTTIVVGSDYAPLVPLPGIGSPTSFPAYLIGLYKLALMSIGIFAMMMILYGGFKYMTSAGNPAAISDAKDAIWSAIFGLILALLSWLILSTVNPELTMVKPPGTAFVPFSASSGNNTITCSIDGDLANSPCQCISGYGQPNPPPLQSCNQICDVTDLLGRNHCTQTVVSYSKDNLNFTELTQNVNDLTVNNGEVYYFKISLKDPHPTTVIPAPRTFRFRFMPGVIASATPACAAPGCAVLVSSDKNSETIKVTFAGNSGGNFFGVNQFDVTDSTSTIFSPVINVWIKIL